MNQRLGKRKQGKLFGAEEHIDTLKRRFNKLESLKDLINFEIFRPDLELVLRYKDGTKGGRPPYDPVMMFKVLILMTMHNSSYEQTEYLIKDRLSWQSFLGLELGDSMPDDKTIWLFEQRLTDAKALAKLFNRFNKLLIKKGYVAMGGQIIDGSIVESPKQRNSKGEDAAIKSGSSAEEIWDNPHKACQKDTDARSVTIVGKKKKTEAGMIEVRIPKFGYKNHIGIDRTFGFIRKCHTTAASTHDSQVFRKVLDLQNCDKEVWADSAYRSQEHEDLLPMLGLSSRIHEKKPKGKPMPIEVAKSNNEKSKIRCRVEHVFGYQNVAMAIFIRSKGIKRANTKITLNNLAYNMHRLLFWEKKNQKTG